MKTIVSIAVILVLGGCASGPSAPTQAEQNDQVEATRQFLEDTNAATRQWIHLRGPLNILSSNVRFAQVETDDGMFLLEVDRDCPGLVVLGDDEIIEEIGRYTRSGTGIRRLNAGVDHIRNCRISAIYDLNPAAAEPAEAAPTRSD